MSDMGVAYLAFFPFGINAFLLASIIPSFLLASVN
jgi:hypothetical protein